MLAPAKGNEDYVADSEDEATKNFKGRVCMVKNQVNVSFRFSINLKLELSD